MDFNFLAELIGKAPPNYGVLEMNKERDDWRDFVIPLFQDNWDELTLRERAIIAIYAERDYDAWMDSRE